MNKNAKLQDIKALRGIGHHLNPVVTIGELIKIKIPAGTADDRKAYVAAIADATESEVIHHIGRMVLLLRTNAKPNPKLSNLARFGL